RAAVLPLQHAVILHRHRIGGERFELHLAPDAVGATDPRDADALGHVGLPGEGKHQLAGAAAFAAAAAALAAAAAFSASSARALRSFRGAAGPGFLRFLPL